MGIDRNTQQVDLEKIIRQYAWKKYFNSKGRTKSFLTKKDKYDVEFERCFLKFSHQTSMKDVAPEDELLNSVDFGTPNRDLRRSKRFKRMVPSPGCFYKSVSMDFDEPVVLETMCFDNPTTAPHCRSISTEKTTTSTLSVEFAQSYGFGQETNIELTLSSTDFVSTSELSLAESDRCLFVTNPTKQEFENVSDLDLVGNFTVKPFHRTKATLVARQEVETKEFEVKTQMSMPIGCFPVVIRRKSDKKVIFTCFVTSLYDVFRHHIGPSVSIIQTNGKHCDVILKSSGKCKHTKWVDPELIVRTEPLGLDD